MGYAVTFIVIGLTIFFFRAYILPLIHQNNLKLEYQSMAEPRLLLQAGESDIEFWQRVEREQERFRQSGNSWALKQMPVIAIPQNQVFTITWFGDKKSYSTVGMSQMEYVRMAVEIYKTLCAEWSRQINITFDQEQVNEAKGFVKIDPEKVWQ